MRLDHSHDCEGTKDDVRSGVGERSRGQITIATVKNNIQAGGGVRGQTVRSQL